MGPLSRPVNWCYVQYGDGDGDGDGGVINEINVVQLASTSASSCLCVSEWYVGRRQGYRLHVAEA